MSEGVISKLRFSAVWRLGRTAFRRPDWRRGWGCLHFHSPGGSQPCSCSGNCVQSSVEEPQGPDGCYPEFVGKPEGNHKSMGGRRRGDRKILRLNLKYKGRVEAATTGISLRRPQDLALRSSRPCGDSAPPHLEGSEEGLGGLISKVHALSPAGSHYLAWQFPSLPSASV